MLITFGDVFRFEDKEYVYLALINGVTYAALICEEEDSRMLVRMRDVRAKQGKEATHAKLYCFVVLTTPPFDGRAAMLGHSNEQEVELSGGTHMTAVSDADLEAIKREILESRGVPRDLLEYVRGIDTTTPAPSSTDVR
jgi:hypothetical protein